MGMSIDTLQNYKMLAGMIPELDALADTGIVTVSDVLPFNANIDFID